MQEEQYKEDLKDIREIMNKSSRFISLSGWSGVSAGFFALCGVYAAYQTVYANQDYLGFRSANITIESLLSLLAIAVTTLIFSVGVGFFFTTRQAKRQGESIWDHQTKKLLGALLIPLLTGGVLCLILLSKGYIGIVAPLTLIFYGLGLVNASKYTLREIKSLGLLEVMLGLLATYFIGYGLLFWGLGFGVLHMVYGVVMQVKYKS